MFFQDHTPSDMANPEAFLDSRLCIGADVPRFFSYPESYWITLEVGLLLFAVLFIEYCSAVRVYIQDVSYFLVVTITLAFQGVKFEEIQ